MALLLLIVCGLFSFIYVFKNIREPVRNKSSSGPKSNPAKTTAWVRAQEIVERHLKAPASADYGGISDGQGPRSNVRALGNNEYHVKGWVDAKNAYGTKVRTYFNVVMKDEGTGVWAVVGDPIFTE